ncbi:EC1118_1J11_0298p [Saccharomyces cerevisiae EC1118]|uniref:EC1118_1J11_0298p n=1 Tax=Saccharomyces cerevisiae (strain Lalvin EC1118 / Prise de mousse) TaxID=643680 RepID=C8ZB18_YEAS8|nr:EC1118_1J11_0298p [Saccharomyces cerevisiae EC1118]
MKKRQNTYAVNSDTCAQLRCIINLYILLANFDFHEAYFLLFFNLVSPTALILRFLPLLSPPFGLPWSDTIFSSSFVGLILSNNLIPVCTLRSLICSKSREPSKISVSSGIENFAT